MKIYHCPLHNLQVQLENHVFILDEIVEKAHDNTEDSGNKEISSSFIPAEPEGPPSFQGKS